MKSMFALLFAAHTLFGTAAVAASDFLAKQNIAMKSKRSEQVLLRASADLRAVFSRYQPALDSSSKIVRPVKITGSVSTPVMQLSIQKCIGFICQTVDLDALISIRESHGSCTHNFLLNVDLARSSREIRDVYERLEALICYQGSADGTGSLQLSTSAVQAVTYSSGFVQREVLKLLRMQVAPIVSALEQTLKYKENH